MLHRALPRACTARPVPPRTGRGFARASLRDPGVPSAPRILQQRPFTARPSACSASSSSSVPDPPAPPVSEASISAKLARKFPEARVRVEDVSGGCGSFFVVEVVEKSFEGVSMLKQHQIINRTLADDIPRIHGLQIHTSVPSQQPSSSS
ncbi:hypothetical protein PTTG_05209 [Puccinia triticina 1-1 BBBD Race 1]|uniref:BolA protein n=2 Tax=Puccinia triticina TaxID=208348 RepID=A0A180GQD8_PUCT1|nr:uncharacterized protein PtA15_16A73 [Puccinia triticina]OAV95047.1 hypothetical protein PTTG_05209 [Puccinia triticina 1-1 BBBD Race 1]WAQ92167.1 hypothetical protein PtA15_16A73 [Puccinia triticina]WAR63908.1 hypothetical protein PtB15_16B67 [Puccinia triticina]